MTITGESASKIIPSRFAHLQPHSNEFYKRAVMLARLQSSFERGLQKRDPQVTNATFTKKESVFCGITTHHHQNTSTLSYLLVLQ